MSVLAEVAVDVFHLEDLVVGHFGLGEQHVHVAGHAAGHGMDRVAHVHALGDQLLRHLFHRVLRARDGQAVARNDDHALGVAEQERDVFRRARLDRLLLRVRWRGAFGAAEAAEDDAEERAVHRLAHDVGEDRARRADERSRDDEQRVVQREADARRRPSRIAVQHRDHDRHVGAADRDDDQHAEHERDRRHHDEGRPLRAGRRDRRTRCRDRS